MDRFKNYSKIVYDTQIIIYYCFSYGKYRLTGRTSKARDLTQYLVDNGIEIYVPKFIVEEVNNKSIPVIVNEYVEDKRKPILEWPSNPSSGLELKLVKKVKENFNNLQKKNYFNVVNYTPSVILFNSIKSFYINFNDKNRLNDFLNLKNTGVLSPSDEDMMLILFAKDYQAPLISNDADITFFAYELINENLAFEIVNFKEIAYSN